MVSICKKGDPTKQERYRPISRLNSIYKIIAGIAKLRIEKEVEEHHRTRNMASGREEARRNRYS